MSKEEVQVFDIEEHTWKTQLNVFNRNHRASWKRFGNDGTAKFTASTLKNAKPGKRALSVTLYESTGAARGARETMMDLDEVSGKALRDLLVGYYKGRG